MVPEKDFKVRLKWRVLRHQLSDLVVPACHVGYNADLNSAGLRRGPGVLLGWAPRGPAGGGLGPHFASHGA